MNLKYSLLLASLATAAATSQGNGNGNGNGNGGGNGNGNNGNGNGNGGNGGGGGTGASTGTTNNNGRIPLRSVRSFNGSEDPRSGNDAELIRLSGRANYPDGLGVGLSMFTEPNARGISNLVADPETISFTPGKATVSDMFWQWGQFMDHDIGLTEGHDEAFTIISPTCDNGDIICTIPFQRALHHFTNGVREQINEITGFLDASMVYGHTPERAGLLREFSNGRLKVVSTTGTNGFTGDLMPNGIDGVANADPFNLPESQLFLGGDVRVNEQTGLLAIHTLWVREHNRIAALLRAAFPSATDEELYQMTRKLVTAEIQVITYKEFLPLMIGTFAPSLTSYSGFNPSVNPGVSHEFTTCAFRVGHTFLSGNLLFHDGTGETGNMNLINLFFNPQLVRNEPNLIDEVLIGQTFQAANSFDTKVIAEVRSFLFGAPVSGQGLDLVSLNIQRGRDHGLLKYNDMRVGFGLSRKSSFSDVTSNAEIAAELSAAYGGDINLCDPWICGLAEPPVTGGQVGELFATIIADQFQRLMDGDEFFYLNDGDVSHPQITRVIDVNRITLTDVINFNTVGGVLPNAMQA